MRRLWLSTLIAVGVATSVGGTALAAGPAETADRALDRALDGLVSSRSGPLGAIAVVQRASHREVHTAGVADLRTDRPLRSSDQMRIASVSKAFSGGVALALVDQGVLSFNDTIGTRLPDLPAAWHPVTLRELLAHTSGLPDYTASKSFQQAVGDAPANPPPPRGLLSYVEDRPLRFPPGSDYHYSNSDNIVVGLMVEAATGARYENALRTKVLRPLGLRSTRMAKGTLLPDPFMHGYMPDEPGPPEDVSELVAFGG